MKERKIALFGGTFDPVHLGHTAVVAAAVKHIGADRAIFIPAKYSPIKERNPIASDGERLEMVKLAIEGFPKFDVSDYELKKEGPSYTIETVKYFQDQYGRNALIYWLMGTDVIEELTYWYKVNELIDLCHLSVMYRAGFPAPDFSRFSGILGQQRVEKLQGNVVPTPLVAISSTEIRKRIEAGEDISSMVSLTVLIYIRSHNLYRGK